MEAMRDGLPGHQLDFYRYVRNSTWLGGSEEYSGLAESVPYWFNGMVPLAYGLGDERLKEQVKRVVVEVLGRQEEDGWIGGRGTVEKEGMEEMEEMGATGDGMGGDALRKGERDLWGRFPFVMGLTVRMSSLFLLGGLLSVSCASSSLFMRLCCLFNKVICDFTNTYSVISLHYRMPEESVLICPSTATPPSCPRVRPHCRTRPPQILRADAAHAPQPPRRLHLLEPSAKPRHDHVAAVDVRELSRGPRRDAAR